LKCNHFGGSILTYVLVHIGTTAVVIMNLFKMETVHERWIIKLPLHSHNQRILMTQFMLFSILVVENKFQARGWLSSDSKQRNKCLCVITQPGIHPAYRTL